MTTSDFHDKQMMRLAFQQALRGWGRCSPNPLVGAVVTDCSGRIVGRGYHRRAGCPHAEPMALDDAGDAARGGVLYVTLEPCSTWGRTPPCTERVLASGVRRVVIGCLDANPAHRGAAIAILSDAGIEVTSGVLEAECMRLNEAFFWWINHRRPFVLLKMAMTLDGRIATAGGQSQWISGPPARRMVQRLRRWADAVMVGGDTVRFDNAALTVRSPANWPRQPLRIVWTSRPDFPAEARIWSAVPDQPPMFAKPTTTTQWLEFLSNLGERGVMALLLEGGGELAAAALQAGVVNKIAFFVAPKILGGRDSRPVVGGASPAALSEAIELTDRQVRRIGQDLLITGYCSNVYGID
ncbi:MAG: bifunctional diaminohydroxyphosphoribosylaminopyrimidine deaminase/5-amino-6-(5-phosphoribosylamino)uracil reductase RibD [Lentisphaerae bacterium]|nr:bifunctional diaminohydroxyphosphoribosylaminopyrimidine deaminase/5-amino-6-(5-phosphoribosylamino)uracil reductase RibD [Lentisphaerota bacterium]